MIRLKESEIIYKGYKIQPTSFGWSVWDKEKKIINTATDKEALEYIDDLLGEERIEEAFGIFNSVERQIRSLNWCATIDEFIDEILEFGYDLEEAPEYNSASGSWTLNIITDEEDEYGEPVIYEVVLTRKLGLSNRSTLLTVYDMYVKGGDKYD